MAPPVCYLGYLLEQCSISHFQGAKGGPSSMLPGYLLEQCSISHFQGAKGGPSSMLHRLLIGTVFYFSLPGS